MTLDLFDITAKRAQLGPRDIAFEELATGKTLTYAELDDRASRAATLLSGHGVKHGDRVGVLCRNRAAFFELLFACAKIGAVMAPLNWRAPAPELRGLLDDCGPRLLFVGAEDEDVGRKAASGADIGVISFDDAGAGGYERLLQSAEPHPGREVWPADELWYLLYTSGTTGKPKGVIQTYQMALANYVNISQPIALTAADATLNFLPLFHTAGINLHTLPTLMIGGRVLVLPGFEVEPVMNLIAQKRIDVFFGVPAVYQQIIEHERFADLDLNNVRHWGCGGAPAPEAWLKRFAKQGATICNGFGMTETGPTVFIQNQETAASKPGSVGQARFLSLARIATTSGAAAGPGETGELQIKGPGVTPGYWNRPEDTKRAFTDDGWLRTGDIATYDEDGEFRIAGRMKEMFISGGENVYPAEVENILSDHEQVLECAVIGVPDEKWGETGCAFILPRGGAEPDIEELRTYCRARLAAFKAPKHYVVVADFPRTAAGKIQKHFLTYPEDAHDRQDQIA